MNWLVVAPQSRYNRMHPAHWDFHKLSSAPVDLYDDSYSNYSNNVFQLVRDETYGKDMGQSSWITYEEYMHFTQLLNIHNDSRVLEVACGSGGPALEMVQAVGCQVVGIDINENGINTANKLASERGLGHLARFEKADADKPLRYEDASFDSIICTDAIIHMDDRRGILWEWHRVLKEGGRALYTDPTIISGPVSSEEIAIRSSIGHYVFFPPGGDERLIKECRFSLIRVEDGTQNMDLVAKRWHDSREKHREELVKIESEKNFEGLQRFLSVTHNLAHERRLSRMTFLFSKE